MRLNTWPLKGGVKGQARRIACGSSGLVIYNVIRMYSLPVLPLVSLLCKVSGDKTSLRSTSPMRPGLALRAFVKLDLVRYLQLGTAAGSINSYFTFIM